MSRLSKEQKESLVNSARKYRESLPGSPAEKYLALRGLSLSDVMSFGLGYVDIPDLGHEKYAGMLVIPYIRKSLTGTTTVVALRYRCIKSDCEHSRHGGKYLTMPGDPPRLYNPMAALDNYDRVAITEGELDAITASVSGIPAVGVPGVQSWKPTHLEGFRGFETVYVLADNDIPKIRPDCQQCPNKDCKGHNPGREFAERIAADLPNSKVCLMPLGQDVNDFVLANGRHALKERVAW